MLNLFPTLRRAKLVTRRQWLGRAAAAGCGLSLPRLLHAENSARVPALSHAPTAKNCIYIFLCGGPSQPDLWDLKLDAPSGIRTVFDPIETMVPGIRFGSLIPQVAQHADKLALIRSMTHGDNDHNGAIARTLLGQLPARPGDVYISRDDHPGIGAILQRLAGGNGDVPEWVVLPRPFTTYSPPYKGQSGGFLGAAFDPLTFNKEAKGSLTEALVRLEAVALPEGVDDARLRGRLSLAKLLAADAGHAASAPAVRRMNDSYENALNLVTTSATNRAFDLGREPDRVRDRYGRNEYGQSFLMARRLIEAGVRTVNVFWTFFDTKGCQFNLWDNHGVPNDVCGIDGQMTGVQQLTHQYCTPSFDRSFSALLEDLHDRG
ncbi:MAG: DUF1501 domain-containing protein, partial [Planctomycetia bacterium]|nr:DUF1501 domain-containing protein [Planctomycetia bacterium]